MTIQEWIEEGGDREDDLLRYVHHFHDPLKPWDSAGLNLAVRRFHSSIRWMHDQGEAPAGGARTWHQARRLYRAALTEPDPARREALWAEVFRTLGQIMHLVVDASVPEHTRNDIHPLGGVSRRGSYEYWVSRQHGSSAGDARFIDTFLSAPTSFNRRILDLPSQPGDPIATVPIARLIDADAYDGSNPAVTVGDSAGIAEIANANFFSEDTLEGPYPFPTEAGLTPVNLATPFGRVRRYFSRPAGQGLLPANPLRAECASEAFYQRGDVPQRPPYPCMDGVVWNQVAAHMLPRAVGYARGVLDYFFRGKLSVPLVYWDADGVSIQIQNDTDEEIDGRFDVYARFDAHTEAERRERIGAVNDGARVTIGPRDTVTVPIMLRSPGAASPEAVLVFTGRIGREENAVIGQVFAVPVVEVVQAGFTADVVSTCTATRSSSTVVNQCRWRSINMDVHGTFASNLSEPGIARVQARWANEATPLELDGVVHPVAWQRAALEPDPIEFRLRVPNAGHRTGNLVLDVTLTSGERKFVSLAIFEFATSTYFKSVGPHPAGGWSVLSQRLFDLRVGYVSGMDLRPLPSLTARSIAGYPNPTFTIRQLDVRNPTIAEGVRVSERSYFETAVPTFELFESEEQARDRWASVPEPVPVVVAWEAELQRAYGPMELTFMRAFFSPSPPAPLIRLTAR